MTTVGQVLAKHRGIAPGFDFLRIALAIAILFTHSTDIVSGNWSEYEAGPWQIPVRALVPMFFVLSGFLITGSAQRLRLGDFVLNRAMRIVPALLVDIVIAACVIGPIFTHLTLFEYYTNPKFYIYFTNITGIINYTLPGVFTTNVNPNTVNGSLWTVPFEIGCYVIMALIIVTGLVGRRTVFAVASLVFFVSVLAMVLLSGHAKPETFTDPRLTPASIIANFTTAKHGYYLYFYFLAGCLSYLYRETIPLKPSLMIVSIVVVAMISLMGLFYSGFLLSKIIFCLPFLTYMTLYIGLANIPKIPLYERGDYSYGVYLYGFPLQQSLVAAFPGQFNLLTHFICSVILATGFAMFSWHCIEKPILRYRRKFSFTARKTDPEAALSLPEPEVGSVLKPEPASGLKEVKA